MTIYDDLRDRLDPLDVAGAYGFRIRGRNFDCPACQAARRKPKLKAKAFGGRWSCIRCGEKGDAVDIIRICEGVDHRAAFREACRLAGLGH